MLLVIIHVAQAVLWTGELIVGHDDDDNGWKKKQDYIEIKKWDNFQKLLLADA